MMVRTGALAQLEKAAGSGLVHPVETMTLRGVSQHPSTPTRDSAWKDYERKCT